MTKSQCEKKLGVMLQDACTYLEEETKRLCCSSDLASGDNDHLPKLAMHIALLNLAEKYRPL